MRESVQALRPPAPPLGAWPAWNAYVLGLLGRFNTPNQVNVEQLIRNCLGLPDVHLSWTWQNCPSAQAVQRLTDAMTSRHEIAHGVNPRPIIHNRTSAPLPRFFLRLARCTDDAVRNHLVNVHGVVPGRLDRPLARVRQLTPPPRRLSLRIHRRLAPRGGTPMKLPALSTALVLSLALTTARAADADPTRVLPDGQKPQDARIGKVRTLNDKDFLLHAADRPQEAWEARRQALREQVLVANGLWPMPEKTPLNAVDPRQDRPRRIHDRKSLLRQLSPGHYVSGNLYRPKGKTGKLPGVLCPARPLGGRPLLRRRREGGPGSRSRAAARRPRPAPAIRCRPAAPSSPAWAASSSTTTWSATPTAR